MDDMSEEYIIDHQCIGCANWDIEYGCICIARNTTDPEWDCEEYERI